MRAGPNAKQRAARLKVENEFQGFSLRFAQLFALLLSAPRRWIAAG